MTAIESPAVGMETVSTPANRAEVRTRCFIGATISYNKGLTTCECVIRNLSDGGARIDVDSAISLPTHFHLYIPVSQKRLYAELKWRSDTEAGIEFCKEASTTVAAVGRFDTDENTALRRRVRELEAEIVRLQNRILQLTDGTI